MLELSRITIDIDPSLPIKEQKNINRVLILQTKGEKEIPVFLVNENDWQKKLKEMNINSQEDLFKSIEAFFSSGDTYRQKVCLAGACSANISLKNYLVSIQNLGDLYYFGAIILVEDWQEVSYAYQEELLSFGGNENIFLLAHTNELVERKESYLVLMHHNQKREGEGRDKGYLVEKYASELFHNWEENPDAMAQMPLKETKDLENSILSNKEKLKFQNKYINQYYSSQGALEVSLGTSMSGESLEEINFNIRFLKRDLSLKVQEWQINSHSSLVSLALLKSKLNYLMASYTERGFFTLSDFDSPTDLRHYSIDGIEEGEEVIRVNIRYSYNYKIKELTINIRR